MDRLSLGLVGGLPAKTRAVADYLRQHDSALAHPKALADVDPSDYDVVFYPGATARWRTWPSTPIPAGS